MHKVDIHKQQQYYKPSNRGLVKFAQFTTDSNVVMFLKLSSLADKLLNTYSI